MAKKNQAKVTFLAETKDFRDNVQKASSSITELASELRLNASRMKTNGESVDLLNERQKLLQNELEQAETKTKNLSAQLDSCARNYGENSTEAQRLATQINNAKAAEEKIRQEINSVNTALDNHAKESADAETALSKLKTTISEQETELESLKDEYANAALEYGKTSKEAKDLAKEISALSSDLGKNKNKLEDVGGAAEDAGNDAEKSAEGWTVVKDVIADLASQAVQAAADAFAELMLNGEAALDKLQVKTGLSSKAMEGMGETAYDIFNNGWGESIDDVTESMSTVYTMMGDMDFETLQQYTENAMTLSDVWGYDTTESIRAVNALVNQFGIDAEDAFDLMVQGTQSGLDQNGDLLDTINEYSVQFARAGYSADEMFNMLANGAYEGTWSVDKLGDAFKEYNIRVSDGTVADALMENRKALGMTKDEVKELTKSYGKGGAEGKKAMKSTLDAVMSVEDETERYKLGVSLFGTMWEDLGEDAVVALFDTEGAIDSTNDAMAETKTDAYDNLATSLTTLGRTLKDEILRPIVDSVTPAIKTVVDWCLDNMPILKPIIIGLGVAFGVLATALAISGIISGVQRAFALLNTTLLANPIVLIVAAIAGLVAAFIYLWNNCEGFREFWLNLWETVKTGFMTAWDAVVNFFTVTLPEMWNNFMTWCSEFWTSLCTTISTIASNIWTSVSGFFSNLWTDIVACVTGIWTDVTTWFNSIWTGLVTVATNIWTSVTTWFSMMWTSLTTTVSGIYTDVTTWFSNLWTAIVSTVTNIWTSVTSWFTMIWTNLTTTVSGIWTTVTSWFNNIWTSLVSVCQSIWSTVSSVWNGLRTSITTAVDNIRTRVITVFNAVKTKVSAIWEGIKTTISDAITAARTTITTVINSIRTRVSAVFNSVWNTAKSVWESIKNAIQNPIETAKDFVSDMIDEIVGFFDFDWSLPSLKMPHFSITGSFSLNPLSVPHFGIEWYAKGGILEEPTLFGINPSNGNGMVGGEAGPEAVAPIDVLLDYVIEAVRSVFGEMELPAPGGVDAYQSVADRLENHIEANDMGRMLNLMEDIASRPIVIDIDGNRVAVATASASDNVSGNRLNLKSRGLALR